MIGEEVWSQNHQMRVICVFPCLQISFVGWKDNKFLLTSPYIHTCTWMNEWMNDKKRSCEVFKLKFTKFWLTESGGDVSQQQQHQHSHAMQNSSRDKIIRTERMCDGFRFRPFVISILLFVFHRYLLVDYCRPKRIMYFSVERFSSLFFLCGLFYWIGWWWTAVLWE